MEGRDKVNAGTGGASPGRAEPGPQAAVEQLLGQVAPGRYDTYESLLRALSEPGSQLWLLLWQGNAGGPDARYARMQVEGSDYVPCVTSPRELAASGWNRGVEVGFGVDVARGLYPSRQGLWLNPHGPSGGLGVPWADLHRIAAGLDVHPAGPLRLSEPALDLAPFYALLSQQAHRTPAVRSLRRAWVQPAHGAPYLAIGLDVYDTSPPAVESVRAMMRQSVGSVPEGLPVSTVAVADEHDPVAMWLRAARPFYDRDPGPGGAPAAAPGYGYPPVHGAR